MSTIREGITPKIINQFLQRVHDYIKLIKSKRCMDNLHKFL